MIVADLQNEEYVSTKSSGCTSENTESKGPDENGKEEVPLLLRDFLLSDLKMTNQCRTTVWEIDNPKDSKMFSEVTESTLEKMRTDQLVVHFHNWAITKETFHSSKSLTSFFKVIATDDGHHQGHASNEG